MSAGKEENGLLLKTAKTEANCLGYLSAGPRVSTRENAAAGPRSHVLGVINAFKGLGWQVTPFIVGDRVPSKMQDQQSQSAISKGKVRPFIADIMRLTMGYVNARKAWQELGSTVTWVYERNAALQSLGWIFKKNGIPWILETNAPLFYEAGRERKTTYLVSLVRKIEIQAYQQCDVLVCISQALADIILEHTQISAEKIVIMPNGVDTLLFDPQKYTPAKFFDGFTICYVGKLFDWQGVDLLIKAIAELQNENIDISFVIVGNGPAKETLEQLTATLNLSERVHFVGRVPQAEIPSYIAGADIGYSGKANMEIGTNFHSPLKLYEYMAMAKPVIATDFEDTRRTVIDGEFGYIFQPGDITSLKSALRKAFNYRKNLKNMGENAREMITQNHDWRNRALFLIDSVQEILNSGNAKNI